MAVENSGRTKKSLAKLNRQIAEHEDQSSGGREFFEQHLSDQLILRRASGTVVGKKDFLKELKNNPFVSRVPKQIDITLQGDRALVTLIVVATEKDASVRRFRNIRLFTRSANQWLLEFW